MIADTTPTKTRMNKEKQTFSKYKPIYEMHFFGYGFLGLWDCLFFLGNMDNL